MDSRLCPKDYCSCRVCWLANERNGREMREEETPPRRLTRRRWSSTPTLIMNWGKWRLGEWIAVSFSRSLDIFNQQRKWSTLYINILITILLEEGMRPSLERIRLSF